MRSTSATYSSRSAGLQAGAKHGHDHGDAPHREGDRLRRVKPSQAKPSQAVRRFSMPLSPTASAEAPRFARSRCAGCRRVRRAMAAPSATRFAAAAPGWSRWRRMPTRTMYDCLLPVAGRRRIDRRAATRAEGLQARIAAVGGGLQVERWLSGHLERVAGHRDRNAERRAGAGLAIGAVADHDLLRVGLAFDGDGAAMAGAVDFHEMAPFACSAASSIASMSASDRPKWWPISCTSTCWTIAPSVSSCSAQ